MGGFLGVGSAIGAVIGSFSAHVAQASPNGQHNGRHAQKSQIATGASTLRSKRRPFARLGAVLCIHANDASEFEVDPTEDADRRGGGQ